MAESDTPKPADGVRADSARGAGVPDARLTPDEDGLSATAPPEDDGADDASPVLTDWSPGQAILDDYVVERELGARHGQGLPAAESIHGPAFPSVAPLGTIPQRSHS